jgi:hypothetical protein
MEIKTKRKKERIAVSVEDRDEPMVVMLYVPHLDYPEHEHIEFDKKAVIQLRDFLNKFLENN